MLTLKNYVGQKIYFKLKTKQKKKKELYGSTNIRSKRGRKMHFEDDNTTFCVKTRKT